MSNKQTAVQEAIDLIKQDYEANGRLRLAFVLQTLNNTKERGKQQVIDAYCNGCKNPLLNKTHEEKAEQYYTQTYGGQDNE
jgi:hypothetical protein